MALPHSDLYDSPLCATVADVDFDGQNEILLGTYGQVGGLPLYVTAAPQNGTEHYRKLGWHRNNTNIAFLQTCIHCYFYVISM